MSAKQQDDLLGGGQDSTAAAVEDEPSEIEEKQKLDLHVEITSPSACERHVTVTISRADIDRYLDDAFSEMMPKAAVPGFRAGRAPRKIVESRFRTEVSEQIKGSLLMDSLEQISEEHHFAAISEPELDLEAVEVPAEGPMTFEFTIEVRPEFDLPKWKGLKLKRQVREYTEEDIDEQVGHLLSRYGQLVPFDGPAEAEDYLTLDITGTHGGRQVSIAEEQVVRVRPVLSFVDGQLEGFDKLMAGVCSGETRTAELKLTQDAPNVALRGETITLEFKVLDVKKLKLPQLTEEFLQELGAFDSEQEFREGVRANLERKLEYQQQRVTRQQITTLLTKSADWALPPTLLQRQSSRELERAVMELRRSGFNESEIRARENQLRQNSAVSTATALKEHFILERIAEEEKIDIEEGDYDREISLIALQSGESPRRVRAQLEKRGLMDVLRNQIVERKVLERVQAEADFKDQTYTPERDTTEAISVAAGGGAGSARIPEIKEAAAEKKQPEAEDTSE